MSSNTHNKVKSHPYANNTNQRSNSKKQGPNSKNWQARGDQTTQQVVTNNLEKKTPASTPSDLSQRNLQNSTQNPQAQRVSTRVFPQKQNPQPQPKPVVDPSKQALAEDKTILLTSILDKTYVIPENNGGSPLMLNLYRLLAELSKAKPDAKISLIGSTVGHILSSKKTGYNDIDLLIEVQLTVEDPAHIEGAVKNCADNMRDAIEDSIARMCGSYNYSNPSQHRQKIGQSYLYGQILINQPIGCGSSRCSIIRFGNELEFKTVINVVVKKGTSETVISGLKHPCAFTSDSMRIFLPKEFFNSTSKGSASLQVISVTGSVDQALCDLEKKELHTDQPDGSKYPKANEKMTGGWTCSKVETERAIYEQFCKLEDLNLMGKQNPTPIGRLEKYYKPDEKQNCLKVICALFNFLTHGLNFDQPFNCTDKDYQYITSLIFAHFPKAKNQNISQELLVKWCHLMLILSSTSTSQSLSLGTCHLIKPKDPLKVLFDCLDLLGKHPDVSIKNLPALNAPFQNVEDLLLKIKPFLNNEQLIRLNHFLALNYPHLLEEGFGMLELLVKTLPQVTAERRQELIQLTQASFAKRGVHLPKTFKSLGAEIPSISALVFMCIQELGSSNLTQTQALYDYAKKQNLLGTGEIDAFVCIQKARLNNKPSKEDLDALLNSIKEFSASETPSKKLEELLLKMKPLLNNEQLIHFNHLLAFYYPSLIQEEFEMLQLLLKGLSSTTEQGKLIQLTQEFFEKRGIELSKSFQTLGAATKLPSISSLILTCIEELALGNLAQAEALYAYAKKQALLGEERVDAFVCIQRTRLNNKPSKEDLDVLLNSLKELSTSKGSFKKLEELLLKMKPLLNEEQLIHFNHLLALHYPHLLEEGFGMLELLVKALSQVAVGKRQKLIQLTKECFGKKGIQLPKTFKSLGAEIPSIGALVVMCIQELGSSNLTQTQALYDYAKKQNLLGTGEIDAFVCIQKARLNNKPSKEDLDALLNSIKEFSASETPSKNMEELLLKMKPLLNDEQLIHFNHLLAFYYPSLIQEAFGIFQPLVKALPQTTGERRKGLIQLTQEFLEKRDIKVPGLFKNLSNSTETLSISSLLFKCIHELAPNHLTQAQALWNYAKKHNLFANSAADEVEAFACIQKARLSQKLPKEQLSLLLDEVISLVKQHTALFKENPPKNIKQLVLNLEPLLDNEERILFNQFLASNSPSLLNKGEPLHFKVLHLLLKVLSTNPSSSKCQKLIQLTQESLKKEGIGSLKCLENFNASAETPSMSSLHLMCIRDLAEHHLAEAQTFWEYAKKERVFANAAVDEAEAFASIRGAQLEKNPSKDELTSLVKEILTLLDRLSKSTTSEDTKCMDTFQALFLSLADKLGQVEFVPNEMQLIIFLCREVKKTDFLSASVKDAIKKALVGAVVKLDIKKKSGNAQNNPLIVAAMKGLLTLFSDEATKDTMRQIIGHLRAQADGLMIAKELFNVSGFVPTLIEEMKEGSLEKNINWVTALLEGKLLKYEDKMAWKCCEALLAQWVANPSFTFCKQVRSIFDFLVEALDPPSKMTSGPQKSSHAKKRANTAQKESSKKKEFDKELVTVLVSACVNFSIGAISSKDPRLIKEASKALCSVFAYGLDNVTATIFSDLILACTDWEDSVHTLNIALSRGILSENNFGILMTTCSNLSASVIASTSKNKDAGGLKHFSESMLSNKKLINIILGSKGKDEDLIKANELILDLLEGTHDMPSNREMVCEVLETRLRLLAELYKNRAKSTDDFLDADIYQCTLRLVTGKSSEVFLANHWLDLIEILRGEAATSFFNKYNAGDPKKLFGPALVKYVKRCLDFIAVDNTVEGTKDSATRSKHLNALAKYKADKNLFKEEDYPDFLENYVYCLARLGKVTEALKIIKQEITDPDDRMDTIHNVIKKLYLTEQLPHIYSYDNAELIGNMLNSYILLEKHETLLVYYWIIETWITCSPRSPENPLDERVKEIIRNQILEMIKLMKQQPKLFEDEETDIQKRFKEIIKVLSSSSTFYLFGEELLAYAIQEKIIDDKEWIKMIESVFDRQKKRV